MTTKRKSKTPQPEPVPSTPNSSWMFELDTVESWAYWDNLFSKVECEKIIEIGNSKLAIPAIVGSTTAEVNKDIRDSKVAWLYPVDDLVWAYQRITGAVDSLNKRFFNFDLYGMTEGFQFTKYEAPSGYYGLHVDRGLNLTPRKLSVTIQLNESADFEGGTLSLYEGNEPTEPEMHQGKMVLFPSYTLHEVKPVTKGTRYSLVCWITGKPFK
jgi:PKHD-type hydroxylase